jgi:hypothetical protein
MTFDERIAELEKQLADLKAEIKSAEAAQGVWTPEIGDNYWAVCDYGAVMELCYPTDLAFVKNRFAIGNCFRTKGEAKFAAERLKVLAEMRKYAKGFKPDWSSVSERKYYLFCRRESSDYKDRHVFVSDCSVINYGCIHFASKKDAQACIDGIGEERLLKYYFGEEVPGDG